MPRPYEQRLRADNAEETRRRILDAVAARLREAPTEPVGLDHVARLARVARSTIYQAFGSRAGLFDAFTKDLLARTGLSRLTAAVARSDAREHLGESIRTSCQMYAADSAVYRVLFSMSKLDPDSVGGAVGTMESDRAGGMAYLARRLDEDGVLRAGVTRDHAADLLWILTSFDTFDALTTAREHSTEQAVQLLVETAQQALCRPDGQGRSIPAART